MEWDTEKLIMKGYNYSDQQYKVTGDCYSKLFQQINQVCYINECYLIRVYRSSVA